MLSMSNMKYDAIVGAGIEIRERVELPDDLIPEDSRVRDPSLSPSVLTVQVEIEAKINAGYFSNREVTAEDLTKVKGRGWNAAAPNVSVTNLFEDKDH